MATPGIRKAAMLLMSLDAAAAAELLKSAGPNVVKRIAAEMAYLQASGQAQAVSEEMIGEFFALLNAGRSPGGGDFVRRLLDSALGEQQSREVLGEIEQLVLARDPFLSIRSAPVAEVARALNGESPQAAAVVLAEMPSGKSAELLTSLPESVRMEAVCGMAAGRSPSPRARARIARVVRDRLEAMGRDDAEGAGEDPGRREQKLRKLAVLLRGLDPALRDALTESIAKKDTDAGQSVQDLMVLWEDVAIVTDRCLQEASRSVDAGKLALALCDADEAVAAKIRGNISERARAMLDEETSLLSSPKPDEIQQAREEILNVLRQMNGKGELSFEER